MKKQLPLILTAVVALFIIFANFTFYGTEKELTGKIDRYFLISQAAAFMIGAINLTRIHTTNILRKRGGYHNSIALLLCLWGFFILGLIQSNSGPTYKWIYEATIVPMEATMFSVVAFFIASAAYRAFKVKSLESAVLLISALIVMLGNVPIGSVLWSGFPEAKDWLMSVPNSGAFRGITIGTYIGAFATSLRILLGLERAHLGARD
ncbi:MAG: hypothetical protein KBI39_03865 [Firmicutes bacterium]|nr:hypothetical protein [Candidatus Fermentithermobacillaceae bacterium]HON86767.1 hypothetical protein [Bacillota bacterium]HRC52882.1 hypothetical protein [Bacillota bacterium]